jgi:hypothetical protein
VVVLVLAHRHPRKLLDAAVAECVEFVRELLARPLPERLEPQETLP